MVFTHDTEVALAAAAALVNTAPNPDTGDAEELAGARWQVRTPAELAAVLGLRS